MDYRNLIEAARAKAAETDFAGKFGERQKAREKRFEGEARQLAPKAGFMERRYGDGG